MAYAGPAAFRDEGESTIDPSHTQRKQVCEPTREAIIRADRERVYAIIAYSRPPGHLFMAPAKSGRAWYRRGTGHHVCEIAVELVKCGIKGRIKTTDRFLAGTPNFVPYIRPESDDAEETDPRRMGPVQFARRYKNATPLWRIAYERQSGHSAPATPADPSRSRGSVRLPAFRDNSRPSSHHPRGATQQNRRAAQKIRASGFAPMLAQDGGLPARNGPRAGGPMESQTLNGISREPWKNGRDRRNHPKPAAGPRYRTSERYSLIP